MKTACKLTPLRVHICSSPRCDFYCLQFSVGRMDIFVTGIGAGDIDMKLGVA